MNNLQYLGCIALLGVLASASTAFAQTLTPTTAPIFTPRVGVRYTTEGAGYESFSSFEGFLPVFQTPGNSLTFLQGKLLLDNDSNLATNILLGHRIFSEEANRIIGGYISYSTRDTGKSNFDQLGLGFETLGVWDFRFNAYLPLNGSENQVEQVNLPFFQGDSLMVQRSRFLEVAMSGVDAEVGTRLVSLGNGDLRGYAGVYYYSGGESREAFGWKTRIEARPNDFLGLSLSLQNDDLFNTRLVFSIGANFPGSGARRGKPSKNSALTRMAQSVDNQATILVAVENRTDVFAAMVEPEEQGSTDSIDDSRSIIIHVAPGGTGNGTFEYPYGSIAEALAVAKADNVIYVRSDENTVFPPFTIPHDVRVFSSGPVQVVNVKGLGIVTLPLSGSGIHPTITGTVPTGNGLITLGNNSVISGFNVQVAGNEGARGIQGINISNVTIDNNKISNPFGEGIYLENIVGTTIIHSNTINNIGGNAISLSQVSTPEITNNFITNVGGQGIQIVNASGTSNIFDNTISNTVGNGILLSQVATTEITNNSIENTGGQGIQIVNASQTSNVSDNTINNTNGNAIQLSQVNSLQVNNNNITNASGDGIQIENTSGTSNITLNTISDITGDAIQLSQVISSTVTNNEITNAGNRGIVVETATGTTNISNNTITDAQQESISLSEVTGTVSVNQNAVNGNNNTSGIIVSNSTGVTDLAVNGNTLSENFNDIQVNLSVTNGTVQINNNIISNSGTAIDLQLGGNTNLTSTTINNNQITGTETASTSRGINLQAFDNTSVGNIEVYGNNISNMKNEDGMNFQLNGSSTATFNIADNTISNIQDTDAGDLNFTDGINIEVFDDAKANITVTNNNISQITAGNAIYMQFLGGDNVGNLAITNNTISQITTQGNGIDLQLFDNFDSNTNINATVNVSGNNIFDVQGTGINAFNETPENTIDLTVDSNTINNTSGDGIKLEEISNTQVTNNNIINAGEQGIEVQNINGVTNISKNTITDAQQESISLSEVTGTVSVNQNIVNGNNKNNGITITNTQGEINLFINGNQLTENFNDIRVSLSNTTGTLQINNNTIANSGTALDLQLGDNTNLSSVTLNNNQIIGIDGNVTSLGINLQAFNADVGNVEVSGNTISNIINGDGMNFQVSGNSIGTFTVSGNTISNIQDTDDGDFNFTDGINLESFDTATAKFNLSTNTISQIQSGNGVSGLSSNNANTEFNISNNLIEQLDQGTGFYIQLSDDQDGVFSFATIQLTNNIIDQIKGTAITFSNTASNELNTSVTITGNQVTNVTP